MHTHKLKTRHSNNSTIYIRILMKLFILYIIQINIKLLNTIYFKNCQHIWLHQSHWTPNTQNTQLVTVFHLTKQQHCVGSPGSWNVYRNNCSSQLWEGGEILQCLISVLTGCMPDLQQQGLPGSAKHEPTISVEVHGT